MRQHIEDLGHGLPDLPLTNREFLEFINCDPARLLSSEASTTCEKTEFVIKMLLDLKDVLAPTKEIKDINSKQDALNFWVRLKPRIFTTSLETLAAIQCYAQLVQDKKLKHTPYLRPNGRHGLSILHMSTDELKKRLQAYDTRQAEASEPKAIIHNNQTEEGRKALAAQLRARLKAKPSEPQ